MRTCTRCRLTFPLDQFYPKQWVCKSCSSIRRKAYYLENKDKEKAKIKEWLVNNQDKQRDRQLKKYGITQEDYALMRELQKECCAICGRHESATVRSNYKGSAKTSLHVDHCHITGQVRGLLCFNCNALLGKARDDTAVLENAIVYLKTAQDKLEKQID